MTRLEEPPNVTLGFFAALTEIGLAVTERLLIAGELSTGGATVDFTGVQRTGR